MIDLVDSDCEVTEVRHEKSRLHPRVEDGTREMTASEKLGMNKRRPVCLYLVYKNKRSRYFESKENTRGSIYNGNM